MRISVIAFTVLFLMTEALCGQLLITEFLVDPKDPLESEWVEACNFSDEAMSLAGWSLCDLVGCSEIDSLSIEPGSYFIFCQDEEAFELYYSDFDRILIEVSPWRALNNTGDLILLRTADSIVADSVPYSAGNGDNISLSLIHISEPTRPY